MAQGVISLKVIADLKDFSTKMQNAQRSMQKFGKKMTSIGKNFSIGVTAPIVAGAAASVMAFDKQAKAIAQVEAGLKSTGSAAGFTSKQLQQMASDMQSSSLFGDEEILQGVTAQLLTFTNVAGEQFAQTQQAAIDLASRLDIDLKSATLQLGKALNDPIANLSALSRSGIQFSESQKEVIKSMAESGRLAEAQSLILEELENQYGGSAEAAAAAGLGPFTQFKNIIGDISEEFGKIILEYITPFIQKLRGMADRFQSLSPTIKKTIVVIAGLAAAIGPLLVALGAVTMAIGAISLPVTAVVAAIASAVAAIVFYWDDIVKYFTQGGGSEVFYHLKAVVSSVFEAIQAVVSVFTNAFSAFWAKFGDVISDYWSGTWDFIKELFLAVLDNINNYVRLFKGIFTGNWGLVWDSVKNIFIGAFNILIGVVKRLIDGIIGQFKALSRLAGLDSFEKKIDGAANKLSKFFDGLKMQTSTMKETEKSFKKTANSIKEVGVEAEKTNKKVGNLNVALPTGSARPTFSPGSTATKESTGINMPTGIGDPEDESISETGNALANKLTDLQNRAQEFASSVSQAMESSAESFAVGFGEMLGSAISGGEGFKQLPKMILSTLGDLASQVGKIAIGTGIAVSGIKKALSTLNPAVAIAGGIALVALGSAVSGALSNVGGGGSSSGGSVGSSGSLSGPREFKKSALKVSVEGSLKAQGKDLVTVFNQEKQGEFFNS